MNKVAIKLRKVSKKYTLYHEKPTLVENVFFKRSKEEFWALKDINLVINKGERVGIIGPNGSGKTTLLEIIAGITSVTAGEVEVKGKVVSLIELDAGFHPDLTGEENIFLNGMLVGMTKQEIKREYVNIVKFSGLEKFIDSPFYTYSEGMKLRLGFSIVAHTDPDVVLLDENLAVGDQEFKEKSDKKIKELFNGGKTVLIASHNLNYMLETCKRVIWLRQGKEIMSGPPKVIIEKYRSLITTKIAK